MKKKFHSFHKILKKYAFFKHSPWVIFLVLLGIGLYLRFWHIEEVEKFGWDQARDAWTMRDILAGHLTLIGPKTGVGYMHTGPLYYYFLVPFYFFTNLDPMASNYFNILENVINFVIIYLVTKKLFGTKAGLFATFLFAVDLYLIQIGRTAWNVSLMPGVAAWIFYAIYKVYREDYRYIFVAWTLGGFFFNIHFTAVFLVPILLLSFIFVKDKKRAYLYSLYSIPLYLIWYMPNIIYQIQGQSASFLTDFFKYYFVGFHLQFLLYRLPSSLVMFKALLGLGQTFQPYSVFEYLVPLIFIITVVFFEKDKNKRIFAYLCGLWVIIPLIGFTFYGGPISEYYFLSEVPIVIFIFIYLQQKLLALQYKYIILVVIVLGWSYYAYYNTMNEWIKPSTGGLYTQKQDAYNYIQSGDKIGFDQGDIESYYYQILTDRKKKSK
ncbi:MAG: ArnT family glycosyltransferase [Candidatus Levyibacteriota bacterium]